jgi:DNA-binding NtrC family response regulator
MTSNPTRHANADSQPQEPAMPADQAHVLVVEDEPRLRELLVRAIPDMGFPVVGARTAEDALRALAGKPFAIMVVDLNLPGMDGLTLIEKVRQTSPQMQVIVMTGFGDLESAKRAIRLDIVDFLTKPCHLGELEQSIERARQRLPRTALPSIDSNAAHAADQKRLADRLATLGKAADEQTQRDAEASGLSDPAKPLTLEELKRRHILESLRRNHNNRAAAAAELGMSVRSLYYHLAQMDEDTQEG